MESQIERKCGRNSFTRAGVRWRPWFYSRALLVSCLASVMWQQVEVAG